MKRIILSLAVMALGSTLLTGCLGDDNNNNEKQEYIVTDGVLIVNNGKEILNLLETKTEERLYLLPSLLDSILDETFIGLLKIFISTH